MLKGFLPTLCYLWGMSKAQTEPNQTMNIKLLSDFSVTPVVFRALNLAPYPHAAQ